MTEGSATQDFTAALHEIESNVDVRRLMIVVVHVLVPGAAVALVAAGTGSAYPPELAWLPRHLPWVVGGVLALAGMWTSLILARCHFGMVVNGAKLRRAVRGDLGLSGLNWLGVTTNFVAITALTAGAGATLVGATLGRVDLGAAIGAGLFALALLTLRVQHARANRLCRRLEPDWQHGEIPVALREEHLRKSLDATAADVSIVVTMAVALFTGTFDAMANVGNLAPEFVGAADPARVQVHGLLGLAALTLASLLLSARIVVRLRIALAEHSAGLAELRGERDDPWAFRVTERSFLLFLLVVLLAATVALIGGWTLGGARVGAGSAGVVGGAGLVWYPLQLRIAARQRR